MVYFKLFYVSACCATTELNNFQTRSHTVRTVLQVPLYWRTVRYLAPFVPVRSSYRMRQTMCLTAHLLLVYLKCCALHAFHQMRYVRAETIKDWICRKRQARNVRSEGVLAKTRILGIYLSVNNTQHLWLRIIVFMDIHPSYLRLYPTLRRMRLKTRGKSSLASTFSRTTLTRCSSLVFSCWKTTLGILERMLQEAGMPYVRIDGSISTSERNRIIKQFQEDNDTNLLLMTTGTGAVG